jgi:hypothetical protein
MDDEEYLQQVGMNFNHDLELIRSHHTEMLLVDLHEEIESNIRASHVFLNKGYFLLVLKAKERKKILLSARDSGVINTSPPEQQRSTAGYYPSVDTPMAHATPGPNINHNQQSYGGGHVPPTHAQQESNTPQMQTDAGLQTLLRQFSEHMSLQTRMFQQAFDQAAAKNEQNMANLATAFMAAASENQSPPVDTKRRKVPQGHVRFTSSPGSIQTADSFLSTVSENEDNL